MIEEKIINYNGIDYIVSSNGHVYSTHDSQRSAYHQEISQHENADGYMTITTGATGNRKSVRVHRLVAMAFIPNPNNLPEVNHKDCNRKNNDVSNLEWCTHAYNIQYAIDQGNHISTTNLSGKNNPNYGNHKLADLYANNPELAKQNNSRQGGQNGRAKAVKLIDTNNNTELFFNYIREAARYLIDNGLVKSKNLDCISDRLAVSAKNHCVCYKHFKPEFCD